MKFGKWALLMNLLAISGAALATEQYPAADFQPKVLYRDEAVTGASAPAASDKKAQKAEKSASHEQSDFDPRFPAANFHPKVIFSAN